MEYLLIAAAAIIGGLAGYFMSLRKARTAVAEELAKARRRAEQAIKAARGEVAAELEEKDQTVAALESRVEETRQKAEQERSRIQADLAHLQSERTRLAARAQELAQQLDEIRGELRTASDDGMQELEELHEIVNSFEQAVQRMEARRLAADRKMKQEPPAPRVAVPKA